MGYGYLLMGVTMCGLTVTLSIKVRSSQHQEAPDSLLFPLNNHLPVSHSISALGSPTWTSLWSSLSSACTDLDRVRLWLFTVNLKRCKYLQFTLGLFFLHIVATAGVSMVLPADIFLQAWRPSAFLIGGTVNFLGMFLIGLCFGYIVVRCRQTLETEWSLHTNNGAHTTSTQKA